jgi:tetratricopeptide (TPR) repeat protein/CHAT domain-containing protein
MWQALLLGLFASWPLASLTGEPPSETPSTQTQYDRLLQGDDARRAAELAEKIEQAEQADQLDEAIGCSDALFSLRSKVQGPEHWQTISARWDLDALRKVAALSAEQRSGWRKVCQNRKLAKELRAQGKHATAEPLYREYLRWCVQVFGARHPSTATGNAVLAVNLNSQGKFAEAQPFYETVLALCKELLGENHPETALAHDNLGLNCVAEAKYYEKLGLNFRAEGKSADALSAVKTAFEIRREVLGEKDPETARSYNHLVASLKNLVAAAEKSERYDEAVSRSEELLTWQSTREGADNWQTVSERWNLASLRILAALSQEEREGWRKTRQGHDEALLLKSRGEHAKSEPLLREHLRHCLQIFGEGQLVTANSYGTLADVLAAQGKHAEAQPLHQKALDLCRALVGQKHASTALRCNNLACTLEKLGKYGDARPLFQEAFDLDRELYGPKHGETVTCFGNLARNLKALADAAERADNFGEARQRSEELLALRSEVQGADYWETIQARWELDALRKVAALSAEDLSAWRKAEKNRLHFRELRANGQHADSQPLAEEYLQHCIKVFGEKHIVTANSFGALGDVLASQEKHTEALAQHQKALDLCRELGGEKHPNTGLWYNNLACTHEKLGNHGAARPLFRKAVDLGRDAYGPKHRATLTRFGNLARNLRSLSDAAEQSDNFGEAIQYSEELLALRTVEQGAEHWETVTARWDLDGLRKVAALSAEELAGWRNARTDRILAKELRGKGQYEDAESLYRRYLECCVRVFGENHPRTAVGNNELAVNLNTQRKYAEARLTYQKALDISRELLSEKHPETALYYDNLGLSLNADGKYADAQSLFQKALEIRRETFGEKHVDTAATYYNLAVCLKELSKIVEAQSLHQKALDLRLELLGEKHATTAESFNSLAHCLDSQGKYVEAQALYQKALSLDRELLGENHRSTLTIYNNLANVLERQGKYRDAEPIYRKILDLRRDLFGERHVDTARSYDNLGSNLTQQKKYIDAQPLLEKALNLRRELLGEKHLDTAATYNSLGVNLIYQAKWAEASAAHQKALDIRLEALGEKHVVTTASYHNLAMCLRGQGRYADAHPLFEKALGLYRKLLGGKHPHTAGAYHNLAFSLVDQGQYTDAQPLFEKALDIRRQVLGEKHPETAASYSSLAYNLSRQGKYAASQSYYQQGLDISRELLGDRHPQTAADFANLAVNLVGQAKYAEALPVLVEAAAGYEAVRSKLAGRVIGRALDRAVVGRAESPYPLLAATAARLNSPTAAWTAAETELARGFNDEIAIRRGLKLSDEEQKRQTALTSRLEEIQVRTEQLLTLTNSNPAEREELAGVRAERLRLEAELAELAVAFSRREVAGLSQVQAAIPLDTALILWVDVADGLRVNEHWGCVIRQTGEPYWQALAGSGPDGNWTDGDSALPGELERTLASPSMAAAQVEVLSQKLFAQRLAPLVRHLDGVARLYVAGVDKMSGVPVDVLTRDFMVSYVPSGTFLSRLPQKYSGDGKTLLAVGDPAVKPAEDEATKNLVTDPFASRVEVTQLAKLFGDRATVLLGAAASEAALDELRTKGELAQFRYLHFAACGKSNDANPFESAVFLAHTITGDSPSRSNEPVLNGQLTAREILEFWELSADLVTLSSSPPGLSRHADGNGLRTLAQAFLATGSRTVCLSLRTVDETATVLLMIRFYQNLLGNRPGLEKSLSKALALAEAKQWLRELSADDAIKLAAEFAQGAARGTLQDDMPLELAVPAGDSDKAARKDIKPFAHPCFWSAFVLMGDPD